MNIKYIEGDEDIPSGYYIKDGNIFYSLEDLINQKDKEIERLNNIMNELEKWLDETKSGDISFAYSHTLNKLKELKETK